MRIKNAARFWLLQIFADGGTGAAGGDGGAAAESAAPQGVSAESAPVAASPDDRLAALGVPQDKLSRRAAARAKRANAAAPVEQAPAPDQAAADQQAEAPTRMTWEQIMADPEYNKRMQDTVSSRLKASKQAQSDMESLRPALEMLARQRGVDLNGEGGIAALAASIQDDDSFYEDKALELGVSTSTAKHIAQLEAEKEARDKADAQHEADERISRHLQSLQQQGEELKKTFSNFNLQEELKNPTFFRLTQPNSGLSVADAYYAVHRADIQRAQAESVQRQTAQMLSNSIRSQGMRPAENGVSSQAASTTQLSYKNMSKAQRDDFKADLRRRTARGEKVYPGRH